MHTPPVGMSPLSPDCFGVIGLLLKNQVADKVWSPHSEDNNRGTMPGFHTIPHEPLVRVWLLHPEALNSSKGCGNSAWRSMAEAPDRHALFTDSHLSEWQRPRALRKDSQASSSRVRAMPTVRAS